VHAIARFHVDDGGASTFERLATQVRVAVRAEPGNILLNEYKGEGGTYVFYGVWKDAAALEAHYAVPEVRQFLEDAGTVLASPPESETFAEFGTPDARAIGDGPGITYVVGTGTARTGDGDALRDAFLSIETPLRKDPANLSETFLRSLTNPDTIVVVEAWTDAPAWKAHFEEPYMEGFASVAAPLLAAPPDHFVGGALPGTPTTTPPVGDDNFDPSDPATIPAGLADKAKAFREATFTLEQGFDPQRPLVEHLTLRVRRDAVPEFVRIAALLRTQTLRYFAVEGVAVDFQIRQAATPENDGSDDVEFLLYETYPSVARNQEQWLTLHVLRFQNAVFDTLAPNHAPELKYYYGDEATP
jgi:quinol monooxygenase YgiN